MRIYHEQLFNCKHINCPAVLKQIVNMPASRFYVSEERAGVVMSRMERGDKLSEMLPLKRAMFQELYARYKAMRELHPTWNMVRIMSQVVIQPAPCFYISPYTARLEIYKYRKAWHNAKLGRLIKRQ